MDLNEVINIGENKSYDRESVEKRRVTNGNLQTFNGRNIISGSDFDRLGDSAFLSPVNEGSTGVYNAQDDLERMKSMKIDKAKLANSKLPDFIKESIVSNPLNVDPALVDSKMTQFTEQLGQKLGLQKSVNILQQLEEIDEQKSQKASLNEVTNNGGVDYGMIKMIVEKVIDEKFGDLSSVLNESLRHVSPGLSVMSIKDKFLYLDDQDNIYECQMVYKGKNKKRKKQ